MKNTLLVLMLLAAPIFGATTSEQYLREILAALRGGSAEEGMAQDAFGRTRISAPFTLFDSKLTHGKSTNYWDEYRAGAEATSDHAGVDPLVVLEVDANTGTGTGLVVRQTWQRFNYQPAKSQLVFLTGILDHSVHAGNGRSRLGYFTTPVLQHGSPHGMWFEATATNIYICEGGTEGTNKVAREQWNLDRLDGTGPSGVSVDFSAAQIFGIDFEWLGVGRSRFFLVQNGRFLPCHEFTHANQLYAPYTQTPNLPLRWDCYAVSNSYARAVQICGAVISEGGFEPLGLPIFSGNRSNTAYAVGTPGVLTGIRLATNYFDTTVIPEFVVTMNTDNTANYQWLLCLNPGFTNAVTWNPDPSHPGIQVANAITGVTLTGYGTILDSGMVANENSGDAIPLRSSRLLGASITEVPDRLFVVIEAISGTPDISGGIKYRIIE